MKQLNERSCYIVALLLLLLSHHGSSLAAGFDGTGNRQNNASAASAKVNKVVSVQKNGGGATVFSFQAEGTSPTNNQARKSSGSGTIQGIKSALRTTFLPIGFPRRTPDGYLRYSIWSWLQDLSTQLRGVLATQRVLEGVGVGREGATALSALMNYLVRDASGMASTLLFTYTSSSKFRSDVKRWRIFADVMVDIGITFEVAATLFPQRFFLPMISIGNMCKAMCGVAAGACGGVINLYWAEGSDISDINAKFGAQHTVTGALGLLFAALFAKSVSNFDPIKMWALYTFLTVFHIYANTQCMRLLIFNELNTVRMQYVTKQFLSFVDDDDFTLPSPKQVTTIESLFFSPFQKRSSILFGDSFNSCIKHWNKSQAELQDLLASSDQKYIIVLDKQRRRPAIVVSFLKDATRIDHAKAYLHSRILTKLVAANKDSSSDLCYEQALTQLNTSWPLFKTKCAEAGWDLSKTELDGLGYEVEVIS